jgi:hypothetical protein
MVILSALPLLVFSMALMAGQHIRIAPRFIPGTTLRYQIEMRTSTTGTTTTPIANPEGSTQLKQTVTLAVRLDVLDAPSGAKDEPGQVRLRATYEKSHADSETDAYNPEAPSLDASYNRLEGHSIEFTIEPDGRLTDFKGLEGIFSNPSAAAAVLSWVKGLSPAAGFPAKGISIGQKWGSERPLEDTPLAGLIWRTESTYVRNEACESAGHVEAEAQRSSGSEETCAVILTRFEIRRRGSGRDATPDDYRRNGLRTSGTWKGSGESMDSISLASGFVVRSTQTGTQTMDYEISSATTGSKLHYVGRVQSQTEITLLPPAPPQP